MNPTVCAVRSSSHETPPAARPLRREAWPFGLARIARPFPRVGRSIPRVTGGPDEWLLLPRSGRENRIRLTDLLRRPALARPRAAFLTARGPFVTSPDGGAKWGWMEEVVWQVGQ